MKRKETKKLAITPYQPTTTTDGYLLWDLKLIEPNPKQPRKYFDPEKIEALKKSIKRKGILTPLRIAPMDIAGHAKLVDGERRFRAATELGLQQVPVILSPTSKDQRKLFEESVIANFCREDMTEIEIARALQKLMEDNDYNQTDVAEVVGKTTGWVSQMMKYLKLHPEVANDLTERKITPAMALAVSRFEQDKQPGLAKELQTARDKKGKALRHEEIALVVAKAVEGKAKPIKPKKGKPPEMNPHALLIRSLSGHLAMLRPRVAEAADIPVKGLAILDCTLLIQLEQDASAVAKSLKTLLENVSKAN